MIPALKSSLLWLSMLAWIATVACVQAQVAPGQELVNLPPSGQMHELTLHSQVATSVTFPAEITLVSGYGMVLDADAAQDLIDAEKMAITMSRETVIQPVTIVHYAEATPDTLVMRAVRKGTPCYLTVRCGSAMFLFKLEAGEQANLAVIVSDPASSKTNTVKEIKQEQIVKSRTVFSAAELVGILSKARQREFLETVNPSIYEGWQQRRGVSLPSTHGDVTCTITEIQQWPLKDAVVLRSRLETKGGKVYRFKPVDTQVRVGNRSYAVQLADSSGVVEPGKPTQLDVVLQGNALGGKEHLSVQNDFRIELVEDTTSGPPPNDLLPPPAPLLPTVESGSGLSSAQPKVFYEGAVELPPSPEDRRGPLPNLYPGNK